MDFKEVSSIVVDEVKDLGATELIQTENRDENPKKRPREQEIQVTSAGNVTVSSIEDSFTVEGDGIEETQVKDGLFRAEFSEPPKKVCVLGGNFVGHVCVDENLDESVVCVDPLNEKFSVHENLKETANYEVNLGENGCFNGGLDGNDEIRSSEDLPKRENDFNINLSYQEGTQTKESRVDGDFKVTDSNGTVEVTQEKGSIGFDENVKDGGALSGRDVETESEDVDLGGASKPYDSGVHKTIHSTAENYSKVGGSVDQSSLASRDKEVQSRKKRRITSEETVLRRSSRRSSTSSLNYVLKMEESSAVNIASLSSKTKVLSDEIPVGSSPERFKEQNYLPPKLELPPSSKNLNLDEIHIIDIFSIYSLLRSFSTILFLSPFDLEAFVEALKSNFPNSLIDSIHVSILRTLKLQLEFLSHEGSQSASNCLRSLNWELLDLITWPVYIVEYLLIHGSELKPGFKLSRLKLLNSDYYKQHISVKVELLRCLCDDLLEAEVISSELDRRALATEHDMDVDHISNIKMHKKRKGPIDELGGSCLTQEIVDETNDWNSDECCLCKMDGNLICCDGCPAAYHSRCVGIIKDLLPEGDWYCPECVMDKRDPSMKSSKSLRGAELLGTDPYGRFYFCSCGYLLVSDSSETESSYYYYHRDDLNVVIEVLKSSYIIYGGIINSVSMKWNIPVNSGPNGCSDSQTPNMHRDLDVKGRVSSTGLSSLPGLLSNVDETKAFDDRKPSEISAVTEGLLHQSCKSSHSVRRSDSATAIQFMEMASPFASSEGSTEISQAVVGIQMSLRNGADCSNKSAGTLNQIETSENTDSNGRECSLRPNASSVKQTQNIVASVPVHSLKVAESSHMQLEHNHYVNYYNFAQIAASVGRELMSEPSNGINEYPKRSDEDIAAAQMNIISRRVTRFYWSNIQSIHVAAKKESCGWCFFCKNPTDSEDCLLSVTEKFSPEVSKLGSSKTNKESHLTTVVHHILSIEERLFGLLSGPWHNPHYRKHWRKSVLKASNVASLKHLLVTLESNLRRVALSPEWLKVVDSAVTMGSASHALTKGQVSSSKQHGSARKRAKVSHNESNSTSNASGRLGIFWWRGGRLSRQVFHCKVLPHSLAVKAGRQAGCGKIPSLLYLDNSEFARRSRYIEWRAAVEMSTSVTQLACQVREFDMNIRWDSIENTQLFSRLDKEHKKSWRLFKKVTIRRKCVEGTCIKYLLDFGKRRTIPDPVIRHGVMLELSASERKKYWLDESHVPLNLLKAFEEKKLVRMANKTNIGPLREEVSKFIRNTPRKRGLWYLLSKSENYQCDQCNKDVPVREAVSCKECKGFFHKKHFRKSKGTGTSDSTVTCDKCQNKKNVKKPVKLKRKLKKGKSLAQEKITSMKGKPLAQEKITSLKGKPLAQQKIASIAGRPRRSMQRVNYAELENKQLAGTKTHKQGPSKKGITKKRKQGQSKKGITKKSKQDQSKDGITEKVVCWHKRKRTLVYSAFWLNGLLFTRKPNDTRVMDFREGKLLLPSKHSNALCTEPICGLCCEPGYTSTLVYVSCGKCQEWFHGDAFGLNVENTGNILGFRCHNCRNRSPPVCPHLDPTVSGNINERQSNAGVDCVKEVLDFDNFHSGKEKEHGHPPNEDTQGLFHRYVRKQRSDAFSNSNRKDQKACEVPDSNGTEKEEDKILFSNQTPMSSECEIESAKGLESVPKDQKVCAVRDSIHKDQKADTVLDSNHTPLSKACENEKENGHIISVGSLPGESNSSCKSDEDVIETDAQMMENNKVEDG